MNTMIGKPFLWITDTYGKIAVHVTGFSPNRQVALISIDGGEDATPCRTYREMADGAFFAMPGDLSKRPATRTRRTRDESAEKALAMAATVINTSTPKPRKPRGKQGAIRQQVTDARNRAVQFNSGEVTF
jgi:hypothetical protein